MLRPDCDPRLRLSHRSAPAIIAARQQHLRPIADGGKVTNRHFTSLHVLHAIRRAAPPGKLLGNDVLFQPNKFEPDLLTRMSGNYGVVR